MVVQNTSPPSPPAVPSLYPRTVPQKKKAIAKAYVGVLARFLNGA
jgi:hypothetical protein